MPCSVARASRRGCKMSDYSIGAIFRSVRRREALRLLGAASIAPFALSCSNTDVGDVQRLDFDELDRSGRLVRDSILEWWVDPIAVSTTLPYPRSVCGGISSTGAVLVTEFRRNSPVKRVEVGTATIDDHNSPAIWFEDGRRGVVAWSNHYSDSISHIKVTDRSASIESLVTAIDQGLKRRGLTSYAKVFKLPHMSTKDSDYFWLLQRVRTGLSGNYENTWSVLPFTLYQETGKIEWHLSSEFVLVSTGEPLGYISCAENYRDDGGLVLRIALAFNPSSGAGRSFLCYFEIDTVSGEISGWSAPTGGANIADPLVLPLRTEHLRPLVKALPANARRRLFFVGAGPRPPALCYADWEIGREDYAEYLVVRQVQAPGQDGRGERWLSEGFGTAGARIGHGAGANYLPGMTFGAYPRRNDDVVLVRREGSSSQVERYSQSAAGKWRRRVLTTSSEVLARPISVRNMGPAELVVSRIHSYGDGKNEFTTFLADTVAFTSAELKR